MFGNDQVHAMIHKTLRTTPMMGANVTKGLWEIGDIFDVSGNSLGTFRHLITVGHWVETAPAPAVRAALRVMLSLTGMRSAD